MILVANKYTAFRFISESHKECGLCGEIKPHSDFHKDSKNKRALGLAYYCKPCATSKSRAWHKNNSNNAEYRRARRDTYFRHKYGLTLSEYEDKLKAQGNKCTICLTPLASTGLLTHLDHCHKTNKIRSFLCTNCNRGLGSFKDDVFIMKNAISYLIEHTENGTQKEDTCL